MDNGIDPIFLTDGIPTVLRVFFVLWVAVLGGCFGSFINVLVYRLPRGKSPVRPGSACPACGHEIRSYHNIPVFGWLMLRGRCYDCGASISARYPVVEATIALVFIALAVAGPLADGTNVPWRSGAMADHWAVMPWFVFAYHGLLVCSVSSLVLIEFDGDRNQVRFPRSLLVGPLLVGIVAPCFAPQLHRVPLSPNLPDLWAQSRLLAGLSDGVTGLLVGLLAGALALPAADHGPMGKRGRAYLLANVALTGAFLGWQAVYVLVAVTAAVTVPVTMAALRWPRLRRLPWSAGLFVLTTFLILYWKPLDEWQPLPGSAPGKPLLIALAVACAGIFALSLASSAIARRWRDWSDH